MDPQLQPRLARRRPHCRIHCACCSVTSKTDTPDHKPVHIRRLVSSSFPSPWCALFLCLALFTLLRSGKLTRELSRPVVRQNRHSAGRIRSLLFLRRRPRLLLLRDGEGCHDRTRRRDVALDLAFHRKGTGARRRRPVSRSRHRYGTRAPCRLHRPRYGSPTTRLLGRVRFGPGDCRFHDR